MFYSPEQKNLIEGLLDSHFLGRKLSDELQSSFLAAFLLLRSNTLDLKGLRRIESALELMTPADGCQTCNIESYHDITEALIATRMQIRERQGA